MQREFPFVPEFALNFARYFRQLHPMRPEMSERDVDLLRRMKLLVRTLPFPVLRVPARKLLDHIGIPYASPDHYHQRALQAGDAGGTVLSEHFASFQPRHLGEALVRPGALERRLSGLSRWYFAGGMPWIPPARFQTVEHRTGPGDCAHFGPCSEEFVATEWQRLTTVARSIARRGYRPYLYPDGFIRGFLIQNGAQYCFVVTAGKHRAAAVSRRETAVLVRLEWNEYLPVVSRDAADALPLVRAGLFSAATARDLVDYYLRTVE